MLIDFRDSIFPPKLFQGRPRSVIPRDSEGTRLGRWVRRLTYGGNRKAAENSRKIVEYLRGSSPRPRVLVIGGGTVGAGLSELYDSPAIGVLGTDVYPSANTVLVCDGHRLPFEDGVFDGVIIQAVLEHVLEPRRVVGEIHRVLKAQGLVYAETPFMQQVHEGAYDFTRFTLTGHRWLFKGFRHLASGATAGPGTALLWSISYFVRSLGGDRKLAALLTAPFFWLRLLDRFSRPGLAADAASGVFFMGTKTDQALQPRDIVRYYQRSRSLAPIGSDAATMEGVAVSADPGADGLRDRGADER